jgi:hypothetical protein
LLTLRKTVYMTGKGATPEYAMNFLLNKLASPTRSP